MKKYVVRSCPAYSCNGICGADEELFCKDCYNCLLKRIVELCKKEPEKKITNALRKDSQITDWYEVAIGEKPNNAYNLALNILNLLEIEEVDE